MFSTYYELVHSIRKMRLEKEQKKFSDCRKKFFPYALTPRGTHSNNTKRPGITGEK